MEDKKQLIVSFPKLGHFWLDSGLVGLAKIVEEVAAGSLKVSENAIEIAAASANEAEEILKKAYDVLIDRYYDLSSRRQISDESSYNFYYDSQRDEFIAFPKKKPAGIAQIIYNKAPRPSGGQIKWEKKEKKEIEVNGKKVKRNRGILPKKFPTEYKHLEIRRDEIQKRMEEFLDERGLDVTTSGLLVDGPNKVKPKITIKVSNSRNIRGYCYLCGQPSDRLEDANQTIFPLITGSSGVLSFNSEVGGPEKVCWKCTLVGKFVPANGFYMKQGDNIYCFFPYSVSLQKMIDIYDIFQDVKYEDPDYFKNFNHSLGGYYQHPFEVTFAFLYTLYEKLLLRKKEDEEKEEILDLEKLFGVTIERAPLEFYVVHARAEGDTFGFKTIWPFRDTVYFFRLMERIEKDCGKEMKEIMSYLIDFSQEKNEYKTLLRNRVCERILQKESILDLVENHVYSANLGYFKPLFDMLLLYEQIIREDDSVFKEEQEAAVTLGKRIGMAVAQSKNGKKGDLYALRRTRKKADFLEQLNRLQFKFDESFIVPADVYEGKLTDENFLEFKQFCLIAALNAYNAAQSSKSDGNSSSGEK